MTCYIHSPNCEHDIMNQSQVQKRSA